MLDVLLDFFGSASQEVICDAEQQCAQFFLAEIQCLEEFLCEELAAVQEMISVESMLEDFIIHEGQCLSEMVNTLSAESDLICESMLETIDTLGYEELEMLVAEEGEHLFGDLVGGVKEAGQRNFSVGTEFSPQPFEQFAPPTTPHDVAPLFGSQGRACPLTLEIEGFEFSEKFGSNDSFIEWLENNTSGRIPDFVDSISFDPNLSDAQGVYNTVTNRIRLGPRAFDPASPDTGLGGFIHTIFHEKFHGIADNHFKFTKAEILEKYAERFGVTAFSLEGLFNESTYIRNDLIPGFNEAEYGLDRVLEESLAEVYSFFHVNPEMMREKFPEKVDFLREILSPELLPA